MDGATLGTAILGAHFFQNQSEPNQRRHDFEFDDILIHPQWNPTLVQGDVAVIQLPTAVDLIAGAIRPAILPALSDVNYDFANENAVASGWGVFSQENPVVSDVLRYVYDNVITVTQCAISTIGLANAQNICMTGTQNRGVCNGDSGGPLTVARGGLSMHVGISR